MAADPEQTKGETPSPLPTESTSTLTREGSLTPQWMQSKTGGGGGGGTGLPHGGGRSRLPGTEDRPLDSARRGRSESLGGNEALLSKSREHDRPRPSKWAPDDRETWKPKERWASGPDSSKRWLDVQTTGRQKQGWGAGDVLSRSHGDRWNTEGGRWTEDRRQAEDKDYVPKNARWNDEERTDRWRAGGRGEGAVHGRGGPHGKQHAGRRIGSDAHTVPDLNGVHSAEHDGRGVTRQNGRTQYNKTQLLEIRNKMSPEMVLPKGVDSSYPYLFRTDVRIETEEEPPTMKSDDVKGKLSEEPPPPVDTGVPGIGVEELEADSWVYKDPNNEVQGPFSKQEILAWWDEGFFPADLAVQSQLSAKENWVPLEKLLRLWNIPIAKSDGPETDSGQTGQRPLEACNSLATVGSYIPSSLPAEMDTETPADDFHVSQPQPGATLMHALPTPQVRPQPQLQGQVSDLQQTMQNLLLQRQKQQAQQQAVAANVAGMNFGGNASVDAGGMGRLRPVGAPFQQNNPYMNAYGMQQQQQQQQVQQPQRQAGMQENALMTPGILEALQRLHVNQQQQQQQNLNRNQMQYGGYDLNSGLSNPLQSQLQGNPNLAALLNQNQMAQQQRTAADQRTALSAEFQRLLQARSMQAQQGSYQGVTNPMAAGRFQGGIRGAPFMQQPQAQQPQQQQNPWSNQVPGQYNALNSLLQPRPPQQLNPQQQQQQQLAQAMLLNTLQGMRVPNQQLGLNHPGLQNREGLLSMAALQGNESSLMDAMSQNRQRNNMSPPNPSFQSPVETGFNLTGQTAASSSLPPFNYPHQKPQQQQQQPTSQFPQHILQQLGAKPEMMTSQPSDIQKPPSPPMLSLDTVPPLADAPSEEPSSKTSPGSEQRAKLNVWGVTPASAATASLLEIQEQESRTAQQNAAASKEKFMSVQQSAAMVSGGGGWNVQPVKPSSLADIMQEDESKRQAQAAAQSKLLLQQQQQQQLNANPNAKPAAAWAKKAASGRSGSQAGQGGDSGKGSAPVSKERSVKEEQDEEGGFWSLETSETVDDSRDFSHDSQHESEVHLFSGQLKISQQFREWCKVTMIDLGGSGDIALIEFLLSLKSRSEIAEYIQEYFKDAPPDKLSVFISEFLKRKDSDSAQIKKERGGQKSKKKSTKSRDGAKPSSNNNSVVDVDAVSSGASSSLGLEATGSGKGTTTRTRDTKAKPKAKKQSKGQHVPADMLGFKSNVNFDSLYRDNSNG